MLIRAVVGSVSELDPITRIPIARSPIATAEPITVSEGWEISARRATAALTLTDCTPLAKFQVRAPVFGQAATMLGVPFGRAAKGADGVLVVGSGPGEWLLIGPPRHGKAIAARLEDLVERVSDELTTFVDLTHGRALMRLKGSSGARLLAKVCGADLSDDMMPDGAALRSSVAAVATDIIRDDRDAVRSYLVHCECSSGQYLFNSLLDAGTAFAIEIDGFSAPGI
jgi:heterotetrameric sarcosine oxidase gamma subunit